MKLERLPAHPARRIDPTRKLRFSFAEQPYTAFEGDTVGSALYATGIRIFGRSFKYHRPRGLLCCAGRCPNCLVNVDGVPNVRACVAPLREGMQVRAQHAWPSLERDALELFDRMHRLLPVGFYYKTFIHPRALWPVWERVLRHFAGLAEIAYPGEPPGEYEREHLFADVAVIGGGASGLSAALEAAAAGASVLLVDDQPCLGGRWQLSTRPLAEDGLRGRSGWDVVAGMAAEVSAMSRIRVMTEATAFGLYEGGLIGILQGRRFAKLRARATVVCTGGFEYPAVFENNDLPGVMLGDAAQRLQALYGIRAEDRAVVVASDERGLEVALDLVASGVEVRVVADTRTGVESPLADELRERGVLLVPGHTVIRANGRGRVQGAVLASVENRSVAHEVTCDLICTADRVEPAAGLIGHAGGRLRQDGRGRLVPDALPPGVFAGGEVVGAEGLGSVIASGRLAGAEGAQSLNGGDARLSARVAELRDAADAASQRGRALGDSAAAARLSPPTREESGHALRDKAFVCLCEDVSEKDLGQAITEGFDHIETLKRYTTVTMGPCQGKMCHRLSVDLCAAITGRTVAATGTTTARPPLQPVPLGALAARQGEPVKLTPMQHQHVARGARLMDMGQWKRPLAYSSIEDECRAVREAVGVIDVSTLGKLDVKGRDAGPFLDWLHPNRISDLAPGRVRYRLMCDDAGVILDDGVVARFDQQHFLLTTTSGTSDAVEQWLEWWVTGTGRCVHVTNLTGALAAVNVAGPRARDLLEPLTGADLSPAGFPYMAVRRATVAGVPSSILRIGFVGELAYEVYVPADYGEYLWDVLLEQGAPLGIRPFGVEAQRVLRLEKQHVIVSQDTDALTNPYGVDLGGLVRLDKPDFVGRDALLAASARGPAERLVGFRMAGATPPPGEGAAVVAGGRSIGRVSSAKWSPTLGAVIGLAWVPSDHARDGETIEVRVDGGTATATVTVSPFYDPDGARLRS